MHLYKPILAKRRETHASSSSCFPPPAGMAQFYSDAAIFANINKNWFMSGGSWSWRKLPRGIFWANSGFLDPKKEALACHRVVTMARDKQFTHVIFASDCLSLVQRINSIWDQWGLYGLYQTSNHFFCGWSNKWPWPLLVGIVMQWPMFWPILVRTLICCAFFIPLWVVSGRPCMTL